MFIYEMKERENEKKGKKKKKKNSIIQNLSLASALKVPRWPENPELIKFGLFIFSLNSSTFLSRAIRTLKLAEIYAIFV